MAQLLAQLEKLLARLAQVRSLQQEALLQLRVDRLVLGELGHLLRLPSGSWAGFAAEAVEVKMQLPLTRSRCRWPDAGLKES